MHRNIETRGAIRRGKAEGYQRRFDSPMPVFRGREYRAEQRLKATLAEIKAEGLFAKPANEEV